MMSTDGHPPAHVLSEMAEGVLSEAQRAEVRAHVDACSECEAVLGQLTEVTRLLRSAPATLPVPDDVSLRLQAAFEREAQAARTDSAVRDAVPTPAPVAWFRRPLARGLVAAAAVAVVGIAGYSIFVNDAPVDMATSSSDSADSEELADSEALQGDGDDAADAPEAQSEELNSDDLTEESNDEDLAGTAERDVVLDVWDSQTEVSPGCGAALADSHGVDLIGSAEIDEGILVVARDESVLLGWTVPSCDADDAETPLVVDVPAE